MEEELLSGEEFTALPLTVLIHSETGQAAAYDGIHRLITGDASQALKTFAKAKRYKEARWDESMWANNGRWYAMPEWLQDPATRARCTLYWVRSGTESDAELLNMPRR